jgi:hypothetical protein
MKHLRLFENAEDIVWMVAVYWFDDAGSQIDLFTNKQAAENCYIDFANMQKESYLKRKNTKYNFTTGDWLLTIEEAEKWVKDNIEFECKIEIKSKTIKDSYELSEEFYISRNAKNYNI